MDSIKTRKIRVDYRKMINYSIIIPHKDIPDLMRRCLDSIPRREDVQIIVVDDNSDPEIVKFDCFPGLGEPCVEVYFTQEGKGAGYARNVGLEHAVGKWVLFADADDFFCPGMLEKLDAYEDSEAEVVAFDFDECDSTDGMNTQKLGDMERFLADTVVRGDVSPSLYAAIRTAPYAKMISRKFLEDHTIRFKEIPCLESLLFGKLLAVYAAKITVTITPLYVHTSRVGEYNTIKDISTEKNRYETIKRCNLFLRSIDRYEYEEPVINELQRYRHLGYFSFFRFLFRTLFDGMLTAGKEIRGVYCYNRFIIVGKKRYKYRYPIIYGLYLLFGVDSIHSFLRRMHTPYFLHRIHYVLYTIPVTVIQRLHHPLKMEIHIAEHCNLNCIGCSHYSPLAKPAFCNLAVLEKNLQHLCLFRGSFGAINLLGGEPLLNPDVTESFKIVRRYFPDVELKLVTNGTLLPKMSEMFWTACKKYDVIISITVYPVSVDYAHLQLLCKKHGVKYRIHGNKNKYGFHRWLLRESGKGNRDSCHGCGHARCMQLMGSKLFTCPTIAYVKDLNDAFGCKFRYKKGDFLEVEKIKSSWQLRLFCVRSKPFSRYCYLNEEQIEWAPSKHKKEEWVLDE